VSPAAPRETAALGEAQDRQWVGRPPRSARAALGGPGDLREQPLPLLRGSGKGRRRGVLPSLRGTGLTLRSGPFRPGAWILNSMSPLGRSATTENPSGRRARSAQGRGCRWFRLLPSEADQAKGSDPRSSHGEGASAGNSHSRPPRRAPAQRLRNFFPRGSIGRTSLPLPSPSSSPSRSGRRWVCPGRGVPWASSP